MYTREFEHCQVVHSGLENNHITTETLEAIDVLAERLGQLKKTHRAFLGVEFSDELQGISSEEMTLAVS